MPRTAPKHDHQSAAYVVVTKNKDMAHVSILNHALKDLSDKTIVRATTTNDQQIIYFRRAPKMPVYLRNQNKSRAEIEANRTEMRGVLSDIAASFEKKLAKAPARKARDAAESLHNLAAARHGDITAADLKQPLGTIDAQLAHLQRLQTVKNTFQSPPQTNTASMKSMLRRFDRMDDLQKNNLMKILFPSSHGVALLKQEVIVKEMQTLVSLLIKNPDMHPSELASKFCDMRNVELFVNAWLAVRSNGDDGKERERGTTKDYQFAWRRGMDVICSELKKSVVVKKQGAASGKSSPAPLVDTLLLSPVGRETFKPKHKISPHNTVGQFKRLASESDETALQVLLEKMGTPNRQARSLPVSQVSEQGGTPKNRPLHMLLQPGSFVSSVESDSPSSPSFPGLSRRTESGVLEDQILKFSAAEAKAKANADIARIRLQALLHSRTAHTTNVASQNLFRATPSLMNGDDLEEMQGLFINEKERFISTESGQFPALANVHADDNAALIENKVSEENISGLDMSVQSVKVSSLMLPITFDSVPQPLPDDFSSSLPEDTLEDNLPHLPVMLYTAERAQAQADKEQT